MFRLNLFGGAVLTNDGRVVRGRAAHRRRLAVLALLAAARSGRVGRERLVALLWPDRTAESGRHLLSEALYVLRRELGDDAFLIVGDEIGLNHAWVSCDLVALEERIAAGDLVGAAATYTGPFLDGFYVDDAPEFERWVEAERERFAYANARLLEQIAEERERAGDMIGAVEWWRRLLAYDPYSSRVVLRLMQALDAAGDRAAAIQLGATHATLLREELGAEPEPAVTALGGRLRAEPVSEGRFAPTRSVPQVAFERPGDRSPDPSRGTSVAGAPAPDSVGESRTSVPSATGFDSELGMPAAVPRTMGSMTPRDGPSSIVRRFSRTARVPWVVAASLGLLAVVALGRAFVGTPEATPATPAVNVVLLPFAGPTAETAEAGDLHRLLASSLSAVPGIWTIDGLAGTKAGGSWRELPLRDVLDAAASKGARYVITASLTTATPLSVDLTVLHARSGEQIIRTTASGPSEPLRGAIQRMALEVARAIAVREGVRLGEAGYLVAATDSPAALSRFLMARDMLRAAEFDAAADGFRRAIEADSAFLLAYNRLSMVETANPRWDFAAARAAVDAGLARRDQVAPIYGRLLEAQRRFVLREGARAIEEFQFLTVDDPELIDGWIGLGESLYHYRGFAGGRSSDALAAFERVVAIDSAYSPAYGHLTHIAIQNGDAGRARRYAARVRNPKDVDAYRLAVALRFGDVGERRGALLALDTAARNTISNVAYLLASTPVVVDTLGNILLHEGRSPTDMQWGVSYRLLALAAAGRWDEARALVTQVGVPTMFDKWIVAAFLAGGPLGDLAEPMLRAASMQVEGAGGPDLSGPFTATRDAFRAVVLDAFQRGDSLAVARLLRWLDEAVARADASDPEPSGLRGALNARLLLLAGDTTGAERQLEAALSRAPWWVSAWAPLADAGPLRIALAEVYARTGRSTDAERWLNSFGNVGALGDLLYARRVAALRARLGAARTR